MKLPLCYFCVLLGSQWQQLNVRGVWQYYSTVHQLEHAHYVYNQEYIIVPQHWNFSEESNVNGWIPFPKSQYWFRQLAKPATRNWLNNLRPLMGHVLNPPVRTWLWRCSTFTIHGAWFIFSIAYIISFCIKMAASGNFKTTRIVLSYDIRHVFVRNYLNL